MKIIIKFLFIMVSVLLIVNAASADQQSVDTCQESDAGYTDARNDVDILSASYDPVSETIQVCAVLCEGECMPRSQYRFHFDYDMDNGMASYLDTEEGGYRDDGSCRISLIGNNSGTTSDDTVRFVCSNDGRNPKKITGPTEGCTAVSDEGEFCCAVLLSELVREDGSMVEQCDFVDIWVDAHNKGIQDRGPDTDGDDGCSKPTGIEEVLAFIADGTPPNITCPVDVTVECDESTDPDNTGMATAVDDCDPEPGIAYTDFVGADSCPQASIITRTWTATDFAGNASSCDQVITVIDTTPPIISCPADMEEVFDDLPIFTVDYPDPEVSDNCDGEPAVDCSPASGSVFNEGANNVTCTATDGCGNSASCVFTVDVIYIDPTEACVEDCDEAHTGATATCDTTYTTDQQTCNDDRGDCEDLCDGNHQQAYGICQGIHEQDWFDCEDAYGDCVDDPGGCTDQYNDDMITCENNYNFDMGLCGDDYGSCMTGCGGDPECEGFCQSDLDDCEDDALDLRGSCEFFAGEDQSTCIGDCESDEFWCKDTADEDLSWCQDNADGVLEDCNWDCEDDEYDCLEDAYWDHETCLGIAGNDQESCYDFCWDICYENCEDALDISIGICDSTRAGDEEACDTARTSCNGNCDVFYGSDLLECDFQHQSEMQDCELYLDGCQSDCDNDPGPDPDSCYDDCDWDYFYCEADANDHLNTCENWADDDKWDCYDDCEDDWEDCQSDAGWDHDTCMSNAYFAENDCKIYCDVITGH